MGNVPSVPEFFTGCGGCTIDGCGSDMSGAGGGGAGDSADCSAEFSDCSGYYYEGLSIAGSTAGQLLSLGAFTVAGAGSSASINGQLWVFLAWGSTSTNILYGGASLGGRSADWGDWVDFGGASIPGSMTTQIPGYGFISPGLGQGGAANNGNVSCNSTTGICVPSTMMKPRPAGCGAAIAQGAISFGLDVVGAIPGFGNAVSATAAGARAVNGIVAYGGAAYGIATGLPDESPVGAAGAGAGLGLTLADAALEGGKVIPVLGNALSATIGLYDGYQLAKTIGRCW